jgi:hypothetical protein
LEEAIEACRLGNRGANVEIAAEGLREAGWDVEPIRHFDERELERALEDGQPPIVVVALGGAEDMAHAVVLCSIASDSVTVMDPSVGEYVTLPRVQLGGLGFDESVYGTLQIGGMNE